MPMKNDRNFCAISDSISNILHQYTTAQHRYLNEFIEMNRSGADMLMLGVYPNAKEITESYAMLNAVRNKLRADPKDPSITLVSVGDGKSPRTAALFAFRTKWQCVSIDPGLDQSIEETTGLPKYQFWENKIERLTCIPSPVERVNISRDRVIIVATHSHASLREILVHVKGKVRSLIAMPCCVPYEHNETPCVSYRDAGVWSPRNEIKVWRTI